MTYIKEGQEINPWESMKISLDFGLETVLLPFPPSPAQHQDWYTSE